MDPNGDQHRKKSLVTGDPEWTPLVEACDYGHVKTTEALLRHNADPNHVSANSSDPLYWAVTGRRVECVRLLLQYGTDPNFTAGRNLMLSIAESSLADVPLTERADLPK